MALSGYYLGCPSWGLKDWVGNLYRRGTKARDFLAQYAEVFNTVEGNTTFYSLPSAETVERWRDATPESFRFVFKLPKIVTHEKALIGAGRDVSIFLDRLLPLGERLGPVMIQLPPAFGPQHIDRLGRFVSALPSEHRFAIEVRHRAFYDDPAESARLEELLAHFACERVVMDTRAMRAGDPNPPDVAVARGRKPDLPVPESIPGRQPMVRFVGHLDSEVNEPWIEGWATRVARWLDEGRKPYLFAHCPNDLYAPPIARRFHQLLTERLGDPAGDAIDPGVLPPWPGEISEPPAVEQLSLF